MTAYEESSVNEEFVQPHRYKDMLLTLQDNMPHITFNEGKNTVTITKKDMQFEVTHPEEMKELMTSMFKINNFICRQYRRRKHVIKSTVIFK